MDICIANRAHFIMIIKDIGDGVTGIYDNGIKIFSL